jgi:Protein of unknown function (DUF5672)
MLDLPQVTLCALDTRTPALALKAMAHCRAGIRFGRSVFLTEGPAAQVPEGIEAVDIGPIRSAAAYSDFVLRRLVDWVDTSHVLIVQWDGFVLDATRWESAFLATDCLGAPWRKAPDHQAVGNGGFTLRSRRLLLALREPAAVARLHHPEDVCIGRTLRPWLEADHGMVFGTREMAARFAFENEMPSQPTFGFHGAFNLPQALGPQAFAEWLPALPQAMVAGRDGFKLARALVRSGQHELARQLLAQRAVAGTLDWPSRLLRWQAR